MKDMSFYQTNSLSSKSLKEKKRQQTLRLMKSNYMLYLFLLPALTYIFLFHYMPMYGVQIAFKNFSPSAGIWGSPWVGTKWFDLFFSSPRFVQILGNTLSISFYSLAAGFPIPIILAIALHNLPNIYMKKIAQTVTYMPHFISVVVLVGMLSAFLSPRSGFVNTIIKSVGGEAIYFMGEPKWFYHLYVWSGVWQNAGWNSIIYMAALSGVSPELHESSIIDGANKLQRIWHIDVPSIVPTMVIMLILNFGRVMSVGFEKVFLMQNSLNVNVAEVISTYTYKIGLVQAEFSYSTAIGLFNNVINFILVVVVNRIARKLSDTSLW